MKPSFRIDGIAKVTGQKVYGYDLRAKDMNAARLGEDAWPESMCHALLLRAGTSQFAFEGVDAGRFPARCPPTKIVTAKDLVEKKLSLARFENDKDTRKWEHWLLPEGRVARHAGQPVAIAYFNSTVELADAVEWLAAGHSPIQLASTEAPPFESDIRRLSDPLLALVQRGEVDQYGTASSIIRVAGSFPAEGDAPYNPFSVKQTSSDKPDVIEALKRNRKARQTWKDVESSMEQEDWVVLERTFYTPTHDTMFMELESGIAWWSEEKKTLQLALGTQSPAKDRSNVQALFAKEGCLFGKPTIKLHTRYPGGGFGGRDDSGFTPYLVLCALFAGMPVRLAYSRFEQFQVGIKRHASVVSNRLAYKRDTHELQALVSHIIMDGGGESNLTSPVVGLATLHAAGPYRVPRTVLTGLGIVTKGAPAGSMRGFGIPQATLAIDCMVDEIATTVGKDPIDYRLAHLLVRDDEDVTGMKLVNHLANKEIAETAKAHALWTGRAAEKQKRDRPGDIAYGVGFAMCMQAYGTTTDAALASVLLEKNGELTIHSGAVDMGQGSATSIANVPFPILGSSATQVEMGQDTHFGALKLVVRKAEEFDPANPRHTLKMGNAMSASMTAFHNLHAVEQACEVLWKSGIRPAAAALAKVDEKAVTPNWIDGKLVVGEHRFSLAALAQKIEALGRVRGAMVHTYFQNDFARASFVVAPDAGKLEQTIDGLAVSTFAEPGFAVLDRSSVTFPDEKVRYYKRTLYASAGHLLAIEVRLRSGIVRVVDAVTILDAGEVHSPPLLEGQVEGGLAMGIGMALLEEVPPSPAGTDGRINLNRYDVPRIHHVPVKSMSLSTIPWEGDSVLASGARVTKKGVAEAVMTTVAPALLNAFAHATGLRVNRVPLTPARVLEALTQR